MVWFGRTAAVAVLLCAGLAGFVPAAHAADCLNKRCSERQLAQLWSEAQQGDHAAAYVLGQLLLRELTAIPEGQQELRRDKLAELERVLPLLENASRGSHADSSYTLYQLATHNLYELNPGKPDLFREALAEASRRKQVTAMYYLGAGLITGALPAGTSGRQDEQLGLELLSALADIGHVPAILRLVQFHNDKFARYIQAGDVMSAADRREYASASQKASELFLIAAIYADDATRVQAIRSYSGGKPLAELTFRRELNTNVGGLQGPAEIMSDSGINAAVLARYHFREHAGQGASEDLRRWYLDANLYLRGQPRLDQSIDERVAKLLEHRRNAERLRKGYQF